MRLDEELDGTGRRSLRSHLHLGDSEWRATEQNRRAKYYELTAAGRRALGSEAESWQRYVAMVDVILRTT